MDRAPDDLVTAPPTDDEVVATAGSPTAAAAGPADRGDLDLSLRKQRFLEAARAIDPLSPLRRRPFVTVATAAAIGVVAASPAAARAVSKWVPAGLTGRLVRTVVTRFLQSRAAAAAAAAVAAATASTASNPEAAVNRYPTTAGVAGPRPSAPPPPP